MKKIISFLLVLGMLTLSFAPYTAKAASSTPENVYQIGDYVFSVSNYVSNKPTVFSYTTTHTTIVNITDTSGGYIATVHMNTTWEYQDGSYVRCTACHPPTYNPTTYKLTYGDAAYYSGSPYYTTVSRPMVFAIPPTQMLFYVNVTCDTYGEVTASVTSSRPF